MDNLSTVHTKFMRNGN